MSNRSRAKRQSQAVGADVIVANPALRWRELGLLLLAFVVVSAGYVLSALGRQEELNAQVGLSLGLVLALFLAAHLSIRLLVPAADATLLPLTALLTGLGFVIISRLDNDLAVAQLRWAAFATFAFFLTLLFTRDIQRLQHYRYTFFLLGVGFLLMPLVPGLGRGEINGSQLWVRIGGLNFQPGEVAKVLLVIFVAGFLDEKRELLSIATRRIGPLRIPDVRHFVPLLLAWGVSLLVMLFERDLGSSLLFYAVFLVMIYVATGRVSYVIIGLAVFAVGATLAAQAFPHVNERVDTWLHPWDGIENGVTQLQQALFAFGSGGFAGTGLNLGRPDLIPQVQTDFVFAAVGEELGLLGTTGILIAYMLFAGSGFRIAAENNRPFLKLLAVGLTTALAIQTIVILGGVTRVIPLTGITLPFFSYGGSSLIANFVIVAMLLRISEPRQRAGSNALAADEARRARDLQRAQLAGSAA